MTPSVSSSPSAASAPVMLSKPMEWLLAVCTALSVAAVVYQQAMTPSIALSMGVPASALWALSAATQLGYGLGLLMGLPLVDRWEARKLVPLALLMLGGVLLVMAAVQSLLWLTLLCGLAGALSVGGQMLIAHHAKVLPADQRLPLVGRLLAALFAGLLLARLAAGWGSQVWGWRTVYGVAGGVTVVTAGLLLRSLAATPAHLLVPTRWTGLLRAQAALWSASPELRRQACVAACFFAVLNALWGNLAALLGQQWTWSTGQMGLLALTALVSLGAPQAAQRLQQRWGWRLAVMGLGWLLAVAGLLAAGAGLSLPVLLAFLVLAELGVRAVHVLTQGQALSLSTTAAGRVNSLFMSVFFVGGALGSWLGGLAVKLGSWPGLLLFCSLSCSLGLALLHVLNPARRSPLGE